VERSRRALQQLPEGKADWKPHDKSMKFEYLADMVATIPSWVAMQITQDSLDIAPADGSSAMKRTKKVTADDHVKALDEAAETARKALRETTDEHLASNWQLKARGAVVQEGPRHRLIQDTFNHWAHHRGQMTVYFAADGREGAVAVWTLSGRSELRIAHLKRPRRDLGLNASAR
jgi:uncharacterized damage-inducible protein DinB